MLLVTNKNIKSVKQTHDETCNESLSNDDKEKQHLDEFQMWKEDERKKLLRKWKMNISFGFIHREFAYFRHWLMVHSGGQKWYVIVNYPRHINIIVCQHIEATILSHLYGEVLLPRFIVNDDEVRMNLDDRLHYDLTSFSASLVRRCIVITLFLKIHFPVFLVEWFYANLLRRTMK